MSAIGSGPGFSIDTVLFATDFSPVSEGASLYAAAISQHLKTKLMVAHAFTLSEAAREVEARTGQASRQRKDVQERLNLTAEAFPAGLGKTIPVLLEGDPREVIPELANRTPAPLLVLGTHGGNILERHLVGSTAEGCLRRTMQPALTVGPHVKLPKAGSLRISRILYVNDCSPDGARAARIAVRLAEVFGSEIDIRSIVSHDNADGSPGREELSAYLLKSVTPKDAERFSDPRTLLTPAEAHGKIIKHIKEASIDLLVLGINREAHLGMQTRTSKAFQIILDADCPVLTAADCGV